jgi:hypothetical protein
MSKRKKAVATVSTDKISTANKARIVFYGALILATMGCFYMSNRESQNQNSLQDTCQGIYDSNRLEVPDYCFRYINFK